MTGVSSTRRRVGKACPAKVGQSYMARCLKVAMRARRLLHLSPLAGRGRFASGALAKRSKSGEGGLVHKLRLAAAPPHPDSFAALGIRPRIKSGAGSLPARGERWRKWLCLAPQDTNSYAIALG